MFEQYWHTVGVFEMFSMIRNRGSREGHLRKCLLSAGCVNMAAAGQGCLQRDTLGSERGVGLSLQCAMPRAVILPCVWALSLQVASFKPSEPYYTHIIHGKTEAQRRWGYLPNVPRQ